MTNPVRLRLSFEVALREDISAAEWTTLLGQALETLRPALAKGSVPVVTTTKAPENREAIRAGLRAVLDAAEDSAAERVAKVARIEREPVLTTDEQAEAAAHARDVVDRDLKPSNVPLCRCGHAHDRHDRIAEGEPRRGACAACGCRCGIYRATDAVANANGGSP